MYFMSISPALYTHLKRIALILEIIATAKYCLTAISLLDKN